MEGLRQQNALVEAGFTSQEVDVWRTKQTQVLSDAGFSSQEVKSYFGEKEPNLNDMKPFFAENLKTLKPKEPTPPVEGEEPTEPEEPGIFDALEAGFQMSVTGLIARGRNPEQILPEDAGMFLNIVSQTATLAGDLPAMVSGAVAGMLLVPPSPITTPIAAGALAFAFPAAARRKLMDQYKKGDIKSFSDWWERSSAIFLDAVKAGIIGGATSGTGAIVSKALAPVAAPIFARGTAVVASEVAVMTTVGSALEGEIPEPSDFAEAAILVGGLRAAVGAAGQIKRISTKLHDIYAETGVKPAEVSIQAKADPVLLQDLGADNVKIPSSLSHLQEPGAVVPKVNTTKAPKNLTVKNNALSKDTEVRGIDVEPFPEPKLKEPKVLSTDAQAVADRVAPPSEGRRPIDFNEMYRKYIDDLHPIKRFVDAVAGDTLPSAPKNPYVLARLTRGAYGKADQFISQSPFNFTTLKSKGKSLSQVLEPVKENIEGFRAFAIASRTIELEARGVKTGVPLKEAKATVKEGGKQFKKSFRDLVDYQNSTLEYLRDSGIISQEGFVKMTEANKNYIPFHRLMEEGGGAKVAGKGLNVRNPIKTIKGSERQIVDPLESVVKNTYLYITLAERNRVMTAMVDLALESKVGKQFMERVPAKLKPIKVTSPEVSRFFKEHGIEAEAEGFTIFRPDSLRVGPNEIAVFRNGKQEIYRVAPEVAESIRALDRDSVSQVVKMLAIPAKTLRAGAVLTPDFMIRNLVRDQNSAFILSEHGFIPFVDSLKSVGALWKKGPLFQDWVKAGGANAALVAMDRNYLRQNILKLEAQTGLIDKTVNVMKSPIEALRVASELIENATRLGEFKRARQAGKDPFEAALASREVTLDFARMGANGKSINMLVAFWNAHVQGLDRIGRAFKERPVETFTKAVASITLPSVALWWANHDDPRWKEIPNWQKDLFWIVMTKDHIFRIPKPFEMGILFGSMPERALEAFFTDNPSAFKDFNDTMVQAFTPAYVPTAALPFLEHFANRSTLTGGPIIPARLEKIMPEYQYTEYTSESAKILGKFVAAIPGGRQSNFASPILLENYIRAWTGNLGRYALQMADQLLLASGAVPDPVKPTATLADIPAIKAFVIRFPSASTQSITDFYDKYAESQKVRNTIRLLAKQGDFEAFEKELLLDENQSKLVSLDGVRKALGAQMKFIHMVNKNKDMTPIEKRQVIDSLYYNMIDIANFGNALADEVEKALEANK